MLSIAELKAEHARLVANDLSLNLERGQPSDADFDLSLPLLNAVGPDDVITDAGVDVRNYPGGIAGLAEARELFAPVLGAEADEMLIGNSSSLSLMADVLGWAMLRGVLGSPAPWVQGIAGERPKLLVTVPGYDRHFSLATALGYELVPVPINDEGPDIAAVESLAFADPAVKGLYFVPTYSNPTGDSLSHRVAEHLMAMPTAAPDFTIFADDAYAVHHLAEPELSAPKLLRLAESTGNPDRVLVFGSTSKVTFASAGLAFMAMSHDNLAYWSRLFATTSIGPNKLEQWRHVRFLRDYPGGLAGLMRAHAAIIKPKFDAVESALSEGLGATDTELPLASWSTPAGGYFVSVETRLPVAARVVELASEAGVSLTPPGATHPGGVDPENRTIRLAPTRPPLDDVTQSMAVFVNCVQLASAEVG